MSSTPVVDLDALRASVTRQGAQVRELKQKGAAAEDVKAAVDELKKLKLELETQTALQGPAEDGLSKSDKKALDDLLLRKMFVVPSFEIYGGVGGFYDFGPPPALSRATCCSSGAATSCSLINCWRSSAPT
ncbi:Glycyl-tRNA synthetase/DNA polymerase subunit gamma-2 [Phytophthora cactorum]|nr:Glycyl-tRNA synthetase/DNA polymerase subunit gamma-2 [Phytophthora cactorum]